MYLEIPLPCWAGWLASPGFHATTTTTFNALHCNCWVLLQATARTPLFLFFAPPKFPLATTDARSHHHRRSQVNFTPPPIAPALVRVATTKNTTFFYDSFAILPRSVLLP